MIPAFSSADCFGLLSYRTVNCREFCLGTVGTLSDFDDVGEIPDGEFVLDLYLLIRSRDCNCDLLQKFCRELESWPNLGGVVSPSGLELGIKVVSGSDLSPAFGYRLMFGEV